MEELNDASIHVFPAISSSPLAFAEILSTILVVFLRTPKPTRTASSKPLLKSSPAQNSLRHLDSTSFISLPNPPNAIKSSSLPECSSKGLFLTVLSQ